jgi:hypothetical protein
MEITKTLTIYEIQYSLEMGSAHIIVGTTGPVDDLEVQTHTRTDGLVIAKLAKINPFEIFNKQSINDMNRYVFEIPLNPNETYFRVSVDDLQYTLTQTVTISGIKGKVIPWYAKVSEADFDHLKHSMSDATINPAEYEVKFDGGTKNVSYNEMQFPIKYEMACAITGIQVDESAKPVTF